MSTKYKKSKFAHFFDIAGTDYTALYHSLTMDLIYCHKKNTGMLNSLLDGNFPGDFYFDGNTSSVPQNEKELIKTIIDSKILVTSAQDDDIFTKMHEKATSVKPNISIMYLLLTGVCNLGCKYCTVDYNIKDKKNQIMTEETIHKSIQMFNEVSTPGGKKSIVFFGGEPLLNLPGIEYTVKEIDKYFSRDDISLSINTNGILIDKNVAKLISKNRIFPIISIDGTKEIHDKMRLYPNGQGSHDDVIKGFINLKEAGVKVGISTLVGNHNYHSLTKIIDYFIDTLGAFDLGLTLPHLEPDVASIEIEKASLEMIKAWQLARDRGFYIAQLGKKLQAFINQKIRRIACPGSSCWSMVRVLPSGIVTVCENMGFRGEYIINNVNDLSSNKEFTQHSVIQDWNNRSQYGMKACLKCSAFGICGAGCPYDAYLETGSIFNPEIRNCYFSRKLLEWAIQDLGKQLFSNSTREERGFYVPSKKERQLVLGNTLPVILENRFLLEEG